MMKKIVFLCGLASLFIWGVALAQDVPEIHPPEFDPTTSVGFIRFAHTSIDVGTIDIYREGDDEPIVTNLSYGDFTDFAAFPTTQQGYLARPAGSGPDGEVLSRLNWGVGSNMSWLIVASGLDDRASFIVEPISIVRDDPEDMARVRVVNFVWGGPALAVTTTTGEALSTNLGYINFTDSELEPNTYDLDIISQNGNKVGSLAEVEFKAGTIYTLLIIGGMERNPPIELLVLESPRDETRVRIINNRAEPVEIFYRPGNQLLAAELAVGEESEFITLPSGSVTIVAYKIGTGPTGRELAAISTFLRPQRDAVITVDDDNQMEAADQVLTPLEEIPISE